jgi:hypothetical protein
VEDYDADWKLDLAGGFASLQKPDATMKNYKVGVGVAPAGGMRYLSGFLGGFGGNMDYNQVRESVTIYLPVMSPVRCSSWATVTPRRAPGRSAGSRRSEDS